MWKILQYYIFPAFLILCATSLFAQVGGKIKYSAEGQMKAGRINGVAYRKLIDNVVFKQKGATIYCDSAMFYPASNSMEAFGHVKIVDDSVVITSRKLIYEGNERQAKLRENVVYTKGERQLFTDFLDYDMNTEVANYFNNGKLIDTTNVLTSEIGYFYALENYALFYNNVVLTAPDFTLKADTLKYNTVTRVAYTYGPTEIVREDGTTLYSQGGEFRTVIEQSQFVEGNVETPDYYLEGDQLFFDDLRKYYKAIGNVVLRAKNKDVIIVGDEGYYDKQNGISKVYGRPVMKRVLEADTLYMSADTLVAIESEYDSAKRILGYYDVRIFKQGLQGIADSVSYFLSDSLIYFYHDPVMWNQNNQIEADTIYLEVSENSIKTMHLLVNSFIISEDTIQNYNQIKGRTMTAYFDQNEIEYIDVNGNGELLYYALNEGDSSVMGLNKIFCSTMRIRFRDQEMINFSVYVQPEAQFIPPHELTPELKFLEGFEWREEERPGLYDVAHYLNPDTTATDELPEVPSADNTDENETLGEEPEKATPGGLPQKRFSPEGRKPVRDPQKAALQKGSPESSDGGLLKNAKLNNQ